MDGFVRIPRALFATDAWRKGDDKQRVAIVTLCSVVAYSAHDYVSRYGTVHLECGQMLMSLRILADLWGVTRDVARRILERLEKEGVITIQRGNCGLTHYLTQCSTLTINALHDGLTQQLTQDIEGIQKKVNLKKKYNKKESSENVQSIPSSGRQSTAPAKRFTPPTAEEVQQYLDSKGIVAFSGKEFVDFYEQGGWVYGRHHTPVKNWKACVSTWTKHRSTANGSTTDIYSNGQAGREERMRRFQQHIINQLTGVEPVPNPDDLFAF
ncbi:MAG: GntR family transcriptional regulator [Bacteroidaceae bacterium]|nr:GntR family transcriptional regulator [Bacteroidaceae bacterium]